MTMTIGWPGDDRAGTSVILFSAAPSHASTGQAGAMLGPVLPCLLGSAHGGSGDDARSLDVSIAARNGNIFQR
jgi:hypothetical protein